MIHIYLNSIAADSGVLELWTEYPHKHLGLSKQYL